MMKMKKRIITALVAVISVLSLCACTNGSVSDEPSTNEPNSKSEQQTAIPLEGESGYADYCVKIAQSELEKLDFSSAKPIEVKNKAYARAVTYTNADGNTKIRKNIFTQSIKMKNSPCSRSTARIRRCFSHLTTAN